MFHNVIIGKPAVAATAFKDKRNLLKEYQILIPKEKPEYWSQEEIVFRLKEISKNITSANEMNKFMILLEIIAGKRNLNKLYCLICNEIYGEKV